jgi:hypothetical protein
MKVREELKNVRKELVLATIVSLMIMYFIEPIIKGLGNIIINTSAVVWKSFNDSIYIRIATNQIETELETLIVVLLLLLTIMIYGFFFVIIKTKEVNRKWKKLINGIKGVEEEKNETKEDFVNRIEKDYIKYSKSSKRQIGICLVCLGLFVVMSIFNIAVESVVRDKINRFEISQKIIAPYITENEKNELESKFHLIKNESDYNLVQGQIKLYMNRFGLEIIWK